eukprot:4247368-Amphidinium_carterae.1
MPGELISSGGALACKVAVVKQTHGRQSHRTPQNLRDTIGSHFACTAPGFWQQDAIAHSGATNLDPSLWFWGLSSQALALETASGKEVQKNGS